MSSMVGCDGGKWAVEPCLSSRNKKWVMLKMFEMVLASTVLLDASLPGLPLASCAVPEPESIYFSTLGLPQANNATQKNRETPFLINFVFPTGEL